MGCGLLRWDGERFYNFYQSGTSTRNVAVATHKPPIPSAVLGVGYGAMAIATPRSETKHNETPHAQSQSHRRRSHARLRNLATEKPLTTSRSITTTGKALLQTFAATTVMAQCSLADATRGIVHSAACAALATALLALSALAEQRWAARGVVKAIARRAFLGARLADSQAKQVWTARGILFI